MWPEGNTELIRRLDSLHSPRRLSASVVKAAWRAKPATQPNRVFKEIGWRSSHRPFLPHSHSSLPSPPAVNPVPNIQGTLVSPLCATLEPNKAEVFGKHHSQQTPAGYTRLTPALSFSSSLFFQLTRRLNPNHHLRWSLSIADTLIKVSTIMKEGSLLISVDTSPSGCYSGHQ